MWQQIRAIAWAQFRITRNHLPRTNVGSVLLWCISLLWYGLYAALGVVLALFLGTVPVGELRLWLPVGLLGVFLFWQLVPLFTLSSGWSLQLNKLQVYPVRNAALFGIEVLLRLSTAPEMVLVLAGAFVGLFRNPAIPMLSPLFLLLFVPLNLFLSLGIREFILHAFERNRFRELFAVLIIGIAVLPQLLTRTGLGHWFAPYFFAAARGTGSPWHETAKLAIGSFSILSLAILLFWTALCYFFARRQFEKGLREDEGFRAAASLVGEGRSTKAETGRLRRLSDLPSRFFQDPMAVLLQKEFQSLLRMPRFRVLFGMACIFSVIIFVPIGLNAAASSHHSFMRENFLPIVTLYGLLLLSEVLVLNAFGFDRHAAQVYFVTPVPFETVLRAKNLAAITFIALQAAAVLVLAAVMRVAVTPFNVANAIAAAAVVCIFFLSIGNYTSVAVPRPADPKQTFRKQSAGRMQLWILLCGLAMFVLIGFAFLARWALQSEWALLGVLLVEFAIGFIVYRVATQSAVERGMRDREKFIEALSRGPSPIGSGLS